MAATSLAYAIDERDAILATVFDAIEDGALTVEACQAAGIHVATFRRWLADGTDAQRATYARVRSVAADALAEEAVRIATGTQGDAQDRRLRYDALRWLAGKRRPKDYGDRVEHEVSGTVGVLHLDALRRVDASTRNVLPRNDVARDVADAEGVSIQPIEALPAPARSDDAEGPPSP